MSSGNSDRETDKRSSFFITLVKQHAEVEVVETRGSDDESLTDPQEGWKPSKQAYFITASLGLILFVVALDASILVTALPTIASAFPNGTSTFTYWVITSYLLTCAAFQPLIASLADVFGRKQCLFTSILLFTIGTVICCVSNTYTELIAGRSVQGIGGGGCYSGVLIVLCDVVPLRERAKFNGLIQLIFAVGTIIGPVIGGVICQHTSWRVLFYINLPFCAAGLAVTLFVINYKSLATTMQSKLVSVDWIGSTLFTASITAFLIGLTWGGNSYAWSSPATLCPIVLGLAGVTATIAWERWCAVQPFLRLAIFNNRSAVIAYCITVLQSLILYATTYTVALWLMSIKNLNPTLTGVGLLPSACLMVPTSAISGGVITRLGRFRWAIWAGWTITILATGLLTLLQHNTPTAVWVVIILLSGMGQGFLLISQSVAVQTMAKTSDVPYAASMYAFCRSLGLCFGVAISGTAIQNLLRARLSTLGLPGQIASNAEAYIVVLKDIQSSAYTVEVFGAYNWAFRMLFAVVTGIAGLGFLLSFGIGSFSMDRALQSGQRHVLEEKK